MVTKSKEVKSYSIEVELKANNRKKDNLIVFNSVTFNENEAMDIVKLLFENTVSPLHVEDVIKDYLSEKTNRKIC